MRKTKSEILEAVHDTAKGLYKAGVMDQLALGEYDRLCLAPIAPPVNGAKVTNREEKPA